MNPPSNISHQSQSIREPHPNASKSGSFPAHKTHGGPKSLLIVVRYVWMLKRGGHVSRGTLPLETGSLLPSIAKNPRPPSLYRLYKLTPFLRRGGWAVDPWRWRQFEMESVFPRAFAARAPTPQTSLKRKTKLLLLEGNHL